MVALIGRLVLVGTAYAFVRLLLLALPPLPPVLPEPLYLVMDWASLILTYLRAFWVDWSVLNLLGAIALVAMVLYLVPLILVYLAPEQNLKTKYKADWAFITGGSSGLGRALSFKMGPPHFPPTPR